MKKHFLVTIAVFSLAASICTGCKDHASSQIPEVPAVTVTESLPVDTQADTHNTPDVTLPPADEPSPTGAAPDAGLLPADDPQPSGIISDTANASSPTGIQGSTHNTPDVTTLPSGDPGSADITPSGTSQPSDDPDITPTEEITMAPIDIDSAFYISPITDEIFARINGRSYPDGCTLSLDEIRYIHVLHYDFEGNISEGEIIVNTAVAEDVLEIFRELFDIEYPIEKMTLIDAYDADDERSMEDNNTSAFNYRFIAETTVLSNHALGLAIDINPLYNPYVYVRSDGSTFLQPYNAGDYVDREKDNPYYIRRNDECYNIFISHGFTWGGDWNTKKDYQHFEKKVK